MILTPLFYIIVFFVFCISAAVLYIKKTEPQNRSIYVFCAVVIILPGLITWGCELTSKTIVVIADSFVINDRPQHSVYKVYGHPTISLDNGQKLETKMVRTGVFSKTLINASSKNLLLYPILYLKSSFVPTPFDKLLNNENAPDAIYIPKGGYDKIDAIPDYWFCKPPSEIIFNESFFTRIFDFNKTKWCIVEYDLDAAEN